MKFLFITLLFTLLLGIEARKFDHVRQYLAQHDKTAKPIHKREAQSWLKNSNNIGLGYNPLHGSPVCYTGVCQGDGFQHSVMKLNYVQPAIGSCTTDLIPDFVELQCIPSADLQTSTEVISNTEHLFESTLKRVSYGVDIRYRRYSASYFYSKETRSMIDQVITQDSTAMYTRGEVTFGKLRMFEPFMQLADTFRYVIQEMPCCNDYGLEIDDYIKEFLIDYFGLTYVTELILGGIAQDTVFIGNKRLDELQMRGEDVVRAASVGFFLNFNIRPIPTYNEVQQKQFTDSISTRRSTKLGGDPSAQTMDDWVKSVPTNPVIMNYAVKEISTLLTTKHFPNDTNIERKSKIVELAIQRYLDRQIPICINNCTDSSHGICDVTNNPPFLLGTCVCRPGWRGYDCSESDARTTPATPATPIITPVTPSGARWIIEKQDGIRDDTKLNILTSLENLIERYGHTKKVEIALDVKKWLDTSYVGTWAVIIGGIDCYGSALSYAANTVLVANETKLGWHIIVVRTD